MDGKDLLFYYHLLLPNMIIKKSLDYDSWTAGVASFMLQRAIAIIYLENKFVHKGAALIVK